MPRRFFGFRSGTVLTVSLLFLVSVWSLPGRSFSQNGTTPSANCIAGGNNTCAAGSNGSCPQPLSDAYYYCDQYQTPTYCSSAKTTNACRYHKNATCGQERYCQSGSVVYNQQNNPISCSGAQDWCLNVGPQ